MRIFLLLTVALLLAISPDSSAWVEPEPAQVDVRPGLYLLVSNGKLSSNWQKRLDHPKDAEALKKVLTNLVTVPERFTSYFNDYVGLGLCAEGWSFCGMVTDSMVSEATKLSEVQRAEWVKSMRGRGMLVISYRSLTNELNFNFYPTAPDHSYEKAEFEKLLESAEFQMRIDDQLIEVGSWEALRDGPNTFLLYPFWSSSPEEKRKLESEVVSTLRRGRKANIQAIFSNGDTFSSDFDLTGLDEALILMARKKAEVDQIIEREKEELKKQLAALD